MTRRKDPQPDAGADLTPPAEPQIPPVPEPVPEEVAASVAEVPAPQPAAVTPAPRRSGLFGTLLGGALAAIGGFALSHFDLLGLAQPGQDAELAGLPDSLGKLQSDQTAALGDLNSKIAALADRVAAIEAAPSPTAPDLSALADIDQRLAAIEAMPTDGTATNAALTAKIAELERRIAAAPTADTSALEEQLNAALSRLDAAEAAASTQAAEAERAAADARRAVALDALGAAVAGGQPFTAELEALADQPLAASLGPLAATGVPTLATLQADFPDAARAALSVARDTNADDGWSDRLVDFLAAQTGARPVAPMEGTTPEAILSRAEFALSEGRVADAITEVAALEAAVKAPLEAWSAQATAHLAASAALAAARGE